MAADPPKSDTSRGALLAVVIATAVGALLRLATIAELPLIVMPDSSWFPDDKGYLVWASSILESGDFAGPAVRTPGYPLLIAVTYFLLGISGPAVLIAQHVMGLATVALLTLMAARIAGRWTALVMGCLAALDPWHLLVAHYALSEASMVFAVVAAAAAVLLPRERSWRQALAVGILAGVTCLVRPSGEIWIPFLGLAVLLRGPWRMRELVRPALAFAGGLALSAGPWLVFNFSRGIHGFAVGEAPVLFTTSAYHGILDERCIPADAAPEVRATFVQTVGNLATEESASRFFEVCRATKLSWASRVRWSRDSIRADPLRYLTAVWHTFRWLLNVGHPAHPRIFDELPYWVRRLTLDGTLENNQAANFQGGILEPEMAEKFRMAPGRADSFAARYLRPWGTRGTRGIPQVPLVILAIAAGAAACLRRRWSEATLLAGSLAFVLAHALILYPWQRYSLPSQMLWYLSIPVLVAALMNWRSRLLTPAALALGACSTPPSAEPPSAVPAPSVAPPAAAAPESESAAPATPVSFALAFEHEDSELAAELEPVLRSGARDVERWFGKPFREPFEVLLLPDRAAFTASFPPEWEMGETACWMVAAGVAERLHVLSPRVWKSEACEHDPEDERHVRELLTHELVHVFHGQHNPTRDFTGVEGLDWFVEGLATYASGQLDDGRASAREALEKGLGPARLADAWKGKYRYGVSGSLVEFLERRVGRETIVRMLAATKLDEALALAGTSEAELLAGWRDSVLTADAPR